MTKAEKFIEEHTRNCSNRIDFDGDYDLVHHPWLSIDEARRAVEIAREELIERACDAYCKVCGHYAHKTPTHICRHACDYYDDFKQAMKDE